ncbi:hypothetical protein [Pseudomonas sp. S49]|uniref:hypothetical protein n=1 Tax=Pseudomonas sp. S49 TaxID=1573720 RepID=UPI00132E7802|nr:hypothetical protein [Pseudomonas sp. S49]QHF51767.1 hypothetical protein PspS49_19775 [Pseudomonas sp. S49]
MSELIENLAKAGSFSVKLIIALGIFITWGYCAFLINFFPTGLNLADSLVFIFIALGFGFLYSYWLGASFLAFNFAYSAIKEKNGFEKIFAAIFSFIFFAALGLVAYLLADWTALAASAASGFMLHISINLWKSDLPGEDAATKRKRTWQRVLVFFLAFIIPAALVPPLLGKFIDGTFGFIGVQQKNVSLVLSEDNQKIVSDVAKELNLSVYGCTKDGNQTNIVHHFNVLWHGLGERSLVQLLTYNNESQKWDKKVAKIELDRSGVKVLTQENKNDSFNTCVTLNTDTLFDIYVDKISDDGKARLGEFATDTRNKLETDHLRILSATITGHTDRLPVLKENDSNVALSLRRANSVYMEIKDLFNADKNVHVKMLGQGSLQPKSECPRNISIPEQKECLAVDRRVEIELKVQMKEKDPVPAENDALSKAKAADHSDTKTQACTDEKISADASPAAAKQNPTNCGPAPVTP